MTQNAQKLGDIVKDARLKKRWSQARLSQEASTPEEKVSQQTITNIEVNNVWSKSLPRVLAVLGLDPALAVGGASTDAGAQIPKDGVPIYAVSDGEKGSLELSDLYVGSLERPPEVQRVPGVYAIYMRGALMTPMFRPGDVLIVNPHEPARVEDGALFLSRDRKHFKVAELIKETPTEWLVKQWGDRPQEFAIAKRDFPICERVAIVKRRA